MILQITTFNHREDTTPCVRPISHEKLVSILTNHLTREEKDGPLWCPTEWRTGTIREKGNLEKGNLLSVCCFVADIDDGTPYTTLIDRWKTPDGEPLSFTLYSSHSSTAEHPRYRVVFFLKEPIPAEQWKDAWKRCSYHLTDNHNDGQTKNPAHMFYLPAVPASRLDEAFTDYREGALLSPFALPPIPEPERPKYTAPVVGENDGERKSGEVFNEQATAHDVLATLLRAGWREGQSRGEEISVIRPGKKNNVRSGVIGFVGPNLFYCFSDNAAPLSPGKVYDPFQLVTLLEYGGDYKQSAKALAQRGYGKVYEKVIQNEKVTPATQKSESVKPAVEELIFPCTDLGNAERVIHRHGTNLRYNAAFGWMIWDGKRWQIDDSGEVYRLTEETIRAIPLEAATLARQAVALPTDDPQRESLNKRAQMALSWAIKSEAGPRIKAAVELAQHQAGVYAPPDAFDADVFLLNCQNGIIDLRTGELLPHNREKLCIRICPVNYQPEAIAPLWESCLTRWQPLEEVRSFLQRAAGYSLAGHTGEETAFLLYGLGRNGKSKFTGAIEYIMGDYAGRAPIDIFMENRKGGNEGPTPDKANLAGKRLIIASEIMQSRRFNESFVKDVTGGDKITAAHKFKAPFTFKPQLKLWLYGNHKPIVTGADDGIKARLPLVPFTVTIPTDERDPDLDTKLRAEAEGILAWAVRGCLDWQRLRLSPPAAVILASEAYHEEMDTLAQFFKSCLIFEDDAIATNADITTAFDEWARNEGLDDRSKPKPTERAERLKKEGCSNYEGKPVRHEGKSQRCWLNVRLRKDSDSIEDTSVTGVTGVTPKQGKYARENCLGKDTENPVTTRNTRNVFSIDDLEDPFPTNEYPEEEKDMY